MYSLNGNNKSRDPVTLQHIYEDIQEMHENTRLR